MNTPLKRIATFFYGSFIRREVMALGDFYPTTIEAAKLSGFNITFDPHANAFRSDQHSIFGILVYPTHEELHKLYSRDGVGTFLPEAVIVETSNGLIPAISYMQPYLSNKAPDKQYIQHLIDAGIEYSFPVWYLNHLKQFC